MDSSNGPQILFARLNRSASRLWWLHPNTEFISMAQECLHRSCWLLRKRFPEDSPTFGSLQRQTSRLVRLSSLSLGTMDRTRSHWDWKLQVSLKKRGH